MFFLEDERTDGFYDPDEEENRGPALEIYGTDITLLARQGLLEECFGREAELLELMEILVRRQKNNPVLVGDAGVGKTAIIELFATKIVKNLVPFVLEGRSIVSLDLARIVAGSRYRGEFELRFQRVIDEVMEEPHIIIFIDEIHNITGTGSAEGSIDAANILKPVLSRSGFQCIGATTNNEYQRIEKDPALNRRFQPIQVKEPSIADTISILYGLRPSLESFHNVVILPGAIHLAATLADRYIYDRFLPDKAIDLIDRAAAKEVIRMTSVTQGSVIQSFANASLIAVGRLKLEAFRRGDIIAEYILQEIENSYRNFILTWLEEPLSIPDTPPGLVVSPVSLKIFNRMRNSVLKRVDELLFASSNNRYKKVVTRPLLSSSKNKEILQEITAGLDNGSETPVSLYRISLILFTFWIEREENAIDYENESSNKEYDIVPTIKDNKKVTIQTLSKILLKYLVKTFGYLNHIQLQKAKNLTFYNLAHEDFLETDFEIQESQQNSLPILPLKDEVEEQEGSEQDLSDFKILSEKEEKKLFIYKEYIDGLEPLIRKSLIQSLQASGGIPFVKEDLENLYALFGFLDGEEGKSYLEDLEDPDLLKRARELGDFTSLKTTINQIQVNNLLSSMTGIPIQSISADESEKLLKIESVLHQRVIGQEEAITAIAKAIRRSRLGIQNPNRPIASFLFCGPTGVGKTEVTKALAVSMFGSEQDMIRLDMSEFMEKFTVSRLIGSPPGYIGYEEGGQLTDAVRRKVYSVVLFDEIEKAHPDILNILLQILEDGRLTDSQKRLVPFDNTVIIMTSNAAAEEIQDIINNTKAQTDIEIEESENNEKKENLLTAEEKSSPVLNSKNNEFLNNFFGTSDLIDTKNIEELFTETLPFKTLEDKYSGSIEFLLSGVNENFFLDLKDNFNDNPAFASRDFEKLSAAEEKTRVEKEIEYEKKDEKQKVIDRLKSAVSEKLGSIFLPEFLNRLDDIIIFQPLKLEELRKICDIMVKQVRDRVKSKKVNLLVDDKVKLKLTRDGYNPALGARPLRRLITKYVEDLISENLLRYPLNKKSRIIEIILDVDNIIKVKNPQDDSDLEIVSEPVEDHYEQVIDEQAQNSKVRLNDESKIEIPSQSQSKKVVPFKEVKIARPVDPGQRRFQSLDKID
uniref:Clp protease ATP binding subunit n=1 Tax=Synura sphagnicola TaxID=52556 RepID=A0A3G2QZ07_9STRA|nr:Clp protease ATP binding subunit [Synura sphagnicola]